MVIKGKIIKIILQSLLILLAAIVIVLYIFSFDKLSEKKIKHSVVLLEAESYFEVLCSDKPVFWFSCLDDSLMIKDLCSNEDSVKKKQTYTVGCWVSKYNLYPCLNSRILTINPDSAELKKLNVSQKDIIKKNLLKVAKDYRILQRKTQLLSRYIELHQKDDRGYDTLKQAFYLAQSQEEDLRNILKTFKTSKEKHLSIKFIQKYTLIYKDSINNKEERIPCKLLSKNALNTWALLKPAGNTTIKPYSLFFHRWKEKKVNKDQEVVVSSFPYLNTLGYQIKDSSAKIIAVKINAFKEMDLPQGIIPDGSPIFNLDGELIGVNYKGKIISPSYFGIGFSKILP